MRAMPNHAPKFSYYPCNDRLNIPMIQPSLESCARLEKDNNGTQDPHPSPQTTVDTYKGEKSTLVLIQCYAARSLIDFACCWMVSADSQGRDFLACCLAPLFFSAMLIMVPGPGDSPNSPLGSTRKCELFALLDERGRDAPSPFSRPLLAPDEVLALAVGLAGTRLVTVGDESGLSTHCRGGKKAVR